MKTTQEIYKDLLESNYQEEFIKSGFVTHTFLLSDDLYKKCNSALLSVYPFFNSGQKCNLSSEEHRSQYNIALREIKFNYSTVIDPSVSLNKGDIPNWLNEDRINLINWNSDEIKTYRARYFKYLEKIGRSNSIITETKSDWVDTEWGFPKGRRNYQEKDLSCALREFEEETGFLRANVHLIQNIIPYEEIFTGSNMKSYKHKYFVGHINSNILPTNHFQETEVSDIKWLNYEECLQYIRPYNLEKCNILTKLNNVLTEYSLY